jgi:hypothetical protein
MYLFQYWTENWENVRHTCSGFLLSELILIEDTVVM